MSLIMTIQYETRRRLIRTSDLCILPQKRTLSFFMDGITINIFKVIIKDGWMCPYLDEKNISSSTCGYITPMIIAMLAILKILCKRTNKRTNDVTSTSHFDLVKAMKG